jgi:hypothetical protein
MKLKGNIDWLVLAVSMAGGPTAAAHAAGVSRKTLDRRIDQGLERASFGAVVKLATRSEIPVGQLVYGLGPAHKRAPLPARSRPAFCPLHCRLAQRGGPFTGRAPFLFCVLVS